MPDTVSLILTDKEKDRSDKLISYILFAYYILGFVFAFFYDTWTIAIGVGSLSLVAFYSAKAFLPKSNLYQYVLSIVLGIYMAQFIFQMHGLFEMHFFAFIGSAILIIYQNWRLQIPMLLFVIIHHGLFGYLQNIGFDDIYFTQLGYLELQTFIIHILLAAAIFLICAVWSHELKRYKQLQTRYDQEVAKLQKEAVLSAERKRSKDLLQKK